MKKTAVFRDRNVIAVYEPMFKSYGQADAYTHVYTTVGRDGKLTTHFADGTTKPSVWESEAAMLEAGRTDFRERMRRVFW